MSARFSPDCKMGRVPFRSGRRRYPRTLLMEVDSNRPASGLISQGEVAGARMSNYEDLSEGAGEKVFRRNSAHGWDSRLPSSTLFEEIGSFRLKLQSPAGAEYRSPAD